MIDATTDAGGDLENRRQEQQRQIDEMSNYAFGPHPERPVSPKAPKIFISYARADSEFALKLGKDLRAAGANIWMDQLEITTSKRWDDTIEEALESCEQFLIILSPAAVDSKIVKDELNYALQTDKQIFPVLYQPCKRPFRIQRIQHSDFTINYQSGFQSLSGALNLKSTMERMQPIRLRSLPVENLSTEDVVKMLKELDFFAERLNWIGKGLQHDYEKIISEGEKLVLDQTTGLTWQQSGSSSKMTFQKAMAYISELNHKNFGGYSDWRLPTLEEAMSLIEPTNVNGLFLDPIFYGQQKMIWTADKSPASRAWFVSFATGDCSETYIFINDIASVSMYVRAVR